MATGIEGKATKDQNIDQATYMISEDAMVDDIRSIFSPTIGKDSGYGSLESNPKLQDKLEVLQEVPSMEADEPHNDLDETGTQYSDATGILGHPDINKYIAAFANELSGYLPLNLDASNWERISPKLPQLLMSFATRLAHESTDRMPRQLMYLVYRFRRLVSSPLPLPSPFPL